MKQSQRHEEMPKELALAIGLVWGHLIARQFEDAYTLVQGCLRLWPDNPQLLQLASYAAVETGNALEKPVIALIRKESSKEWAGRVLRRAGRNQISMENA